MSFPDLKRRFQRDVSNVKLLWIFAVFIVTGSGFIYFAEEAALKSSVTEKVTYHLTFETDTDVEVTSTGVESLSQINAKYALLMDAKNRRVLYEKNGYEKAPMASTTKIMTLIIALEYGNLDDMVTVSSYAAKMPKVHLGMQTGEQYRLEDLLYSMMLESHNDSAVAIAEHIGGSVEEFAGLMNEKAKELGAYQTNFVTPNGIDAKDHYSTAYDLALIASYAIENEKFLEIINTPSYSFHEQTKGRAFTVNNKDRFLNSYSGAIGIKTGFTGKAGYCFVGAAKREEKRFVSVVLASGWPPNKSYKWMDTTALMNYGMDCFNEKEVLKAGTTFQQIPVTDSIEDCPVTPYVQENVSLLLSEDDRVDFEIELPKTLSAPVKKLQTIGKITITVNDTLYKVLPLYADEQRTPITYSYVLKKLFYRYVHWQ